MIKEENSNTMEENIFFVRKGSQNFPPFFTFLFLSSHPFSDVYSIFHILLQGTKQKKAIYNCVFPKMFYVEIHFLLKMFSVKPNGVFILDSHKIQD